VRGAAVRSEPEHREPDLARVQRAAASQRDVNAVAGPLFINKARVDLAVHLTVDRYLAMYNEAPTPFVSAKTADEIIASVARVCHRISVSGH
jgi:hypothetical protein